MTVESSVFASTLIAVSTQSELKFLSALPQLASDSGAVWAVADGVSVEGLHAEVVGIKRRFGNLWGLRASVREARALLLSHDIVVAITGAGPLALPFLIAARQLGLRTIFVEAPEWAGKRRRGRLARLADETIVEWEHQLVRHPFATVLGETV